MKKFLWIAVLLLACSPGAAAQEARPLGHVRDEVGMTKEQYAAFRKIREDNKTAVTAVEADATVDVNVRKAKKKELNAQRDAAILNLLDDTQKAKYQAYEARKKAEKKAGTDAATKPAAE